MAGGLPDNQNTRLGARLPYPAYRDLYWRMNGRISRRTNLVGIQNTTAPV